MIEPGEYRRVPMPEYLRMPALSAGVLRTLLERCPAAAWHESYLNPNRLPEWSDDKDVGTIAHEILLEGSRDCVCVIDPLDHPAEKTGNIPDGWTNKSIRSARDAARSAGKIPVLKSDMTAIDAMVDGARRYIDGLRDSEPAIWELFQPGGGDSELTMVWSDVGGTLCRLRADRISTDRMLIVDAKFTNRTAKPDTFGRQCMFGMGYDLGAAFYRRGVKAVCGRVPTYVFLAIEMAPPHLCSLVGLEPLAMDTADRRITSALATWSACVAANRFIAYPTRVSYIEPPAWMLAAAEAEQLDNPSTIFKREAA